MEENHTPVSRHWLESLSTDELIKLADTYGIDIPPELERIFIIEELLEVSSADEQEPTADLEVAPSYLESAALPKQYNISYIEVMIRDPLWVFAFWEIKSHDREAHEKTDDFNGYCLRVIPLNENGEPNPGENSFTVLLGAEDSARYLGFAGQASDEDAPHEEHLQKGALRETCRYVIKLNVIHGESESQIASSQPFCLPKLYNNEIAAEMSCNPLIRLSGVQDLSIIKNSDRHSKVKRQ
ncbi:MAG: DUF4912 domain-containing protein [Treponema sp.]|jgi:hypothetical protein|nr:DUF4912 domain-containing protein [Treponema sp.]